MKSKSQKRVMLVLLIVVIAVLASFIVYINVTSASSNSKDGLWRVVAYRENALLPLWTGNVLYFGEEPVGNIEIRCKAGGKMYNFEASPDLKSHGIYQKLLAGKSITASYDFFDLHHGNPELEEIRIFWTESGGTRQNCLISFE